MNNQNAPTVNDDLTESLSGPSTGSLTEPAAERFHFMDNIRAFAMLAGVVFHAALAYSPLMHNIWFTADPVNSPIMDIWSNFLHLFRMPLFFLIAGFFAFMLITKRGVLQFLKHRVLRILVPFIVFLPIIGISFMLLITWAVEHVTIPIPLITFVSDTNNQANIPPSTMHLWFLYNLFMFCVLTAVATAIVTTIMKRINSNLLNDKQRHTGWQSLLAIAPVSISPIAILCLFPIMILPALLAQTAPFPAADKFYPEIWSFGFYGVFFLVGGLLFFNKALLQQFSPYRHYLLLSSLIAYGYFYAQLPSTITIADTLAFLDSVPLTASHIKLVIMEAIIAVNMTLYCLLMGRQFLNHKNTVLKFISDSSYWVYLCHIPVLIFIQYQLIELNLNIWIKFFLSVSATLTIGWITYVLFVKWTPIGWMLNGRKN